jgi:hypothetical protein
MLSSRTSSRWSGRADTERRSFVAALGTLPFFDDPRPPEAPAVFERLGFEFLPGR